MPGPIIVPFDPINGERPREKPPAHQGPRPLSEHPNIKNGEPTMPVRNPHIPVPGFVITPPAKKGK